MSPDPQAPPAAPEVQNDPQSKRGVAPPPPPPAPEKLPTKFVFLKGAPGGHTLRPTRRGADPATGARYAIGPIIYRTEPLPGGKNNERFVDTEQLECVKRADFPVDAQEVSKLIMESRYFSADTPQIVTLEEYTTYRKEMEELEKMKAETQLKLTQGLRGKRGTKTPAPTS